MGKRALLTLSLSFFVVQLFPAVSRAQTAITWGNLVNATVTGTALQKTAGCDGCQDAGAASQEQLSSDGYVEFRVGELNSMWMAGLSHEDDDTTYADIDFGFRFNGGGYADGTRKRRVRRWRHHVCGRRRIPDYGCQRANPVSKNGQYLKESAAVPQLPLVLDASLLTIGGTIRNAVIAVAPPPLSTGGLLEKAGSPALRARFTAPQIQGFLPAGGAKGKFTFPAPYNTDAVRLTNAQDCAGGNDCLWYVGYRYWRNINNHVGSSDMYIFLGTDTNRGGVGPILLRYDKNTDDVQTGALFDESSPYHWSTGEGWYFSATQPSKLYTFLVGGTQLRRFDILTRQFDSTPAIDLGACPRPSICPSAATYLTQPHSSDDDRVHSASVQDSNWQRIGCVVSRPSGFRYYGMPRDMAFDECHIDKSGRWLILLMNRNDGTRINRIVDIRTGRQTTIDGSEGALGHLDAGYGYAVGADSYNSLPNATILLKFPVRQDDATDRARRPLQQTVGHRSGQSHRARQRVERAGRVAIRLWQQRQRDA